MTNKSARFLRDLADLTCSVVVLSGMSPMAQAGFNTEKKTMGQQSNKDAPLCTDWEHLENGKKFHRQIRHMFVMDACGSMHFLTGARLPKSVSTGSGQGHKDAHPADVSLRPDTPATLKAAPRDTARWPNLRDAANLLIGLMAISLLRVVIALIEAV